MSRGSRRWVGKFGRHMRDTGGGEEVNTASIYIYSSFLFLFGASAGRWEAHAGQGRRRGGRHSQVLSLVLSLSRARALCLCFTLNPDLQHGRCERQPGVYIASKAALVGLIKTACKVLLRFRAKREHLKNFAWTVFCVPILLEAPMSCAHTSRPSLRSSAPPRPRPCFYLGTPRHPHDPSPCLRPHVWRQLRLRWGLRGCSGQVPRPAASPNP